MPTLGVVFALAAEAWAETCTLEMKRLSDPTKAEKRIYWPATAQYFVTGATDGQFSRVVKKEPDGLQAKPPIRGVAKLGSDIYGFVLDTKATESDSNRQAENLFCRLYFDANQNGDLTDEPVIEAVSRRKTVDNFDMYEECCYFPRIDVNVEVDGTKMEYAAFFISVFRRNFDVAPDVRGTSAMARLHAAAYREGQITLGGKPRRIVLVDSNSNGRFDDFSNVKDTSRTPCDMLLIDPAPDVPDANSNPAWSEFRHYVSKWLVVDGQLYDLEVSPTGDKVTLSASTAPAGRVTIGVDSFRAILHDDNVALKVGANKSQPVSLPVGEWKLRYYTIDQTGYEEPGKSNRARSGTLRSTKTDSRPTRIIARSTEDWKTLEVREGRTVAIPFGPPIRPVVSIVSGTRAGEVRLRLELYGAGGETLYDLLVEGERPKPPEFTITTKRGKEVVHGNFEWG
jgi:hypothetical protein